MEKRISKGELALALVFAGVGIVWISIALGMNLWQGFAPDSGFLPLIYGVLLTLLAGAIVANLVLDPPPEEDRTPIGKPLLLLAILIVTVVGMRAAGFVVAISLMLLFLFAGIERRPLIPSIVVAALSTGVLFAIFEMWLRVPLPEGPFGV
jgi:hypothetical protein